MPKVSFVVSPGRDHTLELTASRSYRIGRDPSNDIALEDAKVSRNHAEIVFENGFFVLYDLGSANGTWVDGRRVRVAPLVDGAELRIGNSIGRFYTDDFSATVAGPLTALRPPPPARADLRFDDQPSGPPSEDRGALGLIGSAFTIDVPGPGSRSAAVRNSANEPVLFFRPIHDITPLVAAVVAGMILVTGGAAIGYLFTEGRPLPALSALAITIGFTIIVVAIVPHRTLHLFREKNSAEPVIEIRQRSRFSFPQLSYSIRIGDGLSLIIARRRILAFSIPPRWTVGDAIGQSIARIVKIRRGEFELTSGLTYCAHMELDEGNGVMKLRLADLASRMIDLRIVVALGVILASVRRP